MKSKNVKLICHFFNNFCIRKTNLPSSTFSLNCTQLFIIDHFHHKEFELNLSDRWFKYTKRTYIFVFLPVFEFFMFSFISKDFAGSKLEITIVASFLVSSGAFI
jgi:hypothetical protein